MSSADMAAIIGRRPSESYDKGTRIGRNATGRIRERSLWSFDSPLAPEEDLSCHLDFLAGFYEERRAAFEGLRGECSIEIFCGFSSGSGQGGLVLGHLLLKRLASLDVDLVLDLYPPTPDDTDDADVANGEADE